ncbi:MAG TPA: hypothetical protein VFU94_03690 [Conexibacter sp.]|nr:hypothetical protein [Conexibacter sp.]
MSEAGETAWDTQYAAKLPLYERLRSKVQGLLAELVEAERLDVSLMEARVKEHPSFLEKIERKGYENPLDDITDLVGLRIITYYTDDRERIAALIRREFRIDEDASSVATYEDPERFGYASDQYVVELRPERAALTDWAPFADIRFEIQVRTVLQHAWAAISHKLTYKRQPDAPRELRRQLVRLSALLELADEQFRELRDRTEQLAERRAGEVSGGNLRGIPIDAVTLEAFLASSELHVRWRQRALDVGMRGPSDLTNDLRLDTLPGSRLLDALQAARLEKLDQVAAFFEEAERWGEKSLADIQARGERAERIPFANSADVLTWLVTIGERLSVETIRRLNYYRALEQALVELTGARYEPAADAAKR